MKFFRCKDVGVDCDWETYSENSEEILQEVLDHAKEYHGIAESEELKAKIRTNIHEEKAA